MAGIYAASNSFIRKIKERLKNNLSKKRKTKIVRNPHRAGILHVIKLFVSLFLKNKSILSSKTFYQKSAKQKPSETLTTRAFARDKTFLFLFLKNKNILSSKIIYQKKRKTKILCNPHCAGICAR
jgi:hypothetical protein